MGLKKQNYELRGINIPEAYAMIGKVEIENNIATVGFNIHTSRENLKKYDPLETITIAIKFDRNLSLYEQLYIKSKEDIFKDWQDDIIEE